MLALLFTGILYAANFTTPLLLSSASTLAVQKTVPLEDQKLHDPNPITNFRSWREQSIVKLLLEPYKATVRPRGTTNATAKDGGPVHVETTFYLQAINAINDATMEFAAQFRLQQQWMDERLEFDHMKYEVSLLNFALDQKIWIPDTFAQNEKRGHYHLIDKENMYVKVRGDGYVTYDRRLSMTFACPMDLSRYPHDTQLCQMDFASYAYTSDDIKYIWSHRGIVLETGAKMRPKFAVEAVEKYDCTSATTTGEYSCLRVQLQLRRVFSFFLLQLYIPSVMLVAVSCVSYWIDWKASPARVPLSIVTLLAMITQSASINASLPPVNYTKAIDVWIGACIIFIFFSLLEYAVVNYTGVHEERRKNKQANSDDQFFMSTFYVNEVSVSQLPNESTALLHRRRQGRTSQTRVGPRRSYGGNSDVDNPVGNLEELGKSGRRQRRQNGCGLTINLCSSLKKRSRAERIDIISRGLFPLLFLGFNVVYWKIYWD